MFPAYGQTCRMCKKRNHFARVCVQRASINLVRETICYGFNSNACEDESCEFHQCYVSDAENNWNVEVLINGSSMFLKTGSGAQCNVVSF